MENKHFAGFWIRFLAFVIDVLILWLPVTLCALIFSDAFGMIMVLAVQLAYHTILTAKYGGTMGKRLLRLRVINEEGQHVNYLQSSIRYLGTILSGAIFYLGYLMIGISRSKQGLHDKLCKTYVIRD